MLKSILLGLSLVPSVWADELILKDGKKLEWVGLRDNGDAYDVQGPDGKTVTVLKKDVREIRPVVVAAPLTGATFTGDTTTKSLAPVNLFALVDPKVDLGSSWKLVKDAFIGYSGVAQMIGFDVHYVPPEEYDVEVVVERSGGEGEFLLMLTGGGKHFGVNFDAGGGVSGVRMVDGKGPDQNETGVPTKIFADKKPHKIVVAIRKEKIVALVDGKTIIDWKVDWNRVSSGSPANDKKNNVGFDTSNGTFKLTKAILTPRK
ncbi:MAG TPA: hypothetical protein VKU80_19135 [Planctomycetota bacterium]|nr:hypothetical protein [Planctomycetota bacterium]